MGATRPWRRPRALLRPDPRGYIKYVVSGPSTELEQELKFEAPLSAGLPDLRDLVGRTERLPQRLFSSVYFDTDGMRLWERGLTLRHRIESGETSGTWTLKVPSVSRGPALERTEVSWPGTRDAIPDGVGEITRGIVRRQPLREIVELETVRQRWTLRDDGDRALGEIDDDVVTILSGPRQGARFRQVEFELATEDESIPSQVLNRFASARLCAGAAPKVAVALGLAPPGQDEHRRLDRRSPIRDVLKWAVLNGLERLLHHDWRLRLAAPDLAPEDVHQARVAVRRLRSNLKTLQSVLDPVWTGHVREDLKWIGAALGEVRDADVLRGLLAAAPGELQAGLARDREAAVRRLMPVLASERYLDLLDRLHAASHTPPVLSADDVDEAGGAKDQLRSHVAADWHALGRRVRKAGPDPSDQQLHQIRIGAKRLRYAAEMAEPVIGRSGRRLAESAEVVQAVLGEHHDAVAAESWLRAHVLSVSPGTDHDVSVASAFAAGWLAAGERQSQRTLRRRWLRSWRALRKQATSFAR